MAESKSDSSITLYGTDLSGHVHRVVLLLSMLELPYRFVEAPAEICGVATVKVGASAGAFTTALA